MKRYFDYSDEELYEMKGEEIEELIDLECAIEGIKLVNMPKLPEDISTKPSVDVYTFDNYSSTDRSVVEGIRDMVFALMERGDLITLDYDYRTGSYDHKFTKTVKSVGDIGHMKAYSPDEYEKITFEISAYKARKQAYDKAFSEYKEESKKMAECRERVMTHYYSAVDKISILNNLKMVYQNYLKLSCGDATIAWNFLEKAYPEWVESKNEIVGVEE